MLFPIRSALGGIAPSFPCGRCPVRGGLIGHERQKIEDLAQILFRVDIQYRAASKQAVEDGTRLATVSPSFL